MINDPPPREPFGFLGMLRMFLIDALYPVLGVLFGVSMLVLALAIAGAL